MILIAHSIQDGVDLGKMSDKPVSAKIAVSGFKAKTSSIARLADDVHDDSSQSASENKKTTIAASVTS